MVVAVMSTGYRFINRQYTDLLSAWRAQHITRAFHKWIASVISNDQTFVAKAFYDLQDGSYNAVLLAVDEHGGYSFIEEVAGCMNANSALSNMVLLMEQAINNHQGNYYYQGHQQTSVFKNSKKKNPQKVDCFSNKYNQPALKVIQHLLKIHYDADGNYYGRLMSENHQAALWELYLKTAFTEYFFDVDKNQQVASQSKADFCFHNRHEMIDLEATSINPRPEYQKNTLLFAIESGLTLEDIHNDSPIRKSMLEENYIKKIKNKIKNKHKKAYFNNRPLVLAVADFSHQHAFVWFREAVMNAVYGNKTCKGLFDDDQYKKISAIVVSTFRVMDKFNRIGLLCGLADQSIRLFQQGKFFDQSKGFHDLENEIIPWPPGCHVKETWDEGLAVLHNPKALYPLKKDYFPIAFQTWGNESAKWIFPIEKINPYPWVTYNRIAG